MKASIGIIIYIVVTGLLGFVAFFGALNLVMTGRMEWILPLFVLLLLLFVLFVQVYHRKTVRDNKKRVYTLGILLVISLVYPSYHLYLDSIPQVSAEVNIYQYMPFEDESELRPLQEESNLKFTGELPRLDGATALYPLYAAAAEMIYPEKYYAPYESEIMVNTTPDAYSNLFNGKVDAIFAAAPSEAQMKTAESKGLDLTMTPIGREAFVFFVHAKNPVDSVTFTDIQGIYSGDITNWSELAGDDEEIRAFQRPEDSGSQTTLLKVMGDVPVMEAPVENVEAGMGGIIEEVAEYRNHKNAIGYTFRFYGQEMVGNNKIKYLAIDGVKPTRETIQNSSYPLVSEFYIITTQNSRPEALELVEWFTSEQGQKLVDHAGYVPLERRAGE